MRGALSSASAVSQKLSDFVCNIFVIPPVKVFALSVILNDIPLEPSVPSRFTCDGYAFRFYLNVQLAPKSWTEIVVSVSDFQAAGYFYFADIGTDEEVTILITDIKAYGAKAVQAMIDELPEAATLDDIEQIKTVLKYYDCLSEEAQKTLDIKKLTACEETLTKAVQKMIDGLPTAAELAEEDGKAVEEAREAYEKLPKEWQDGVDLTKLLECEEKMLELPYTIFDMTDEDATENFTHPSDVPSYIWSGDFAIVDDETYGKVLAVQATGATNKVVYMGYLLGNKDLSGYDYVTFSIYNPKDISMNFRLITMGYGKDYLNVQLAPKSWTEITVSVSDFQAAGYFYFADIGTDEEVTILITDIKAYGAKAVQAMIDELPEAATLDDIEQIKTVLKYYDCLSEEAQKTLDIKKLTACEETLTKAVQKMIDGLPTAAELAEEDGKAVEEAREAYEKLPKEWQDGVDLTKLLECEEKMLELPYTIFDMTDEDATENFTHPSDVPSYIWSGDFAIVDDETYGKVLAVQATGATNKVVYMGYLLGNKDLSGYDYVTFSIYNPRDVQMDFALITTGWGKDYFRGWLAPKSWTEIVVSVSDFQAAGYFYFAEVGTDEKVTILITDIKAYGAKAVQAMIDELPEAESVTQEDSAQVTAIRKYYDCLSEEAQKEIDLTKLLACEEKLSELPYIIFDMTDEDATENFTHPSDIPTYIWSGDFAIMDDETYGKVLAVQATGATNKVVYMGYLLGNKDLSGYDYVTFSIYNPRDISMNFALITMGYGQGYLNVQLAPKSWTEITVSVSDFQAAGYFYFADIGTDEEVTILITDIQAYRSKE